MIWKAAQRSAPRRRAAVPSSAAALRPSGRNAACAPGRPSSRRALALATALAGGLAAPAAAQLAKYDAVKVAPQPTLLLPTRPPLVAPGSTPRGLAFDGSNLWVVDATENRVYRVDPAAPVDAAKARQQYVSYALTVQHQAAPIGTPGPAAIETSCDRSGTRCKPVALWIVYEPDARPLARARRLSRPPIEPRLRRFPLTQDRKLLASQTSLEIPEEAHAGPITGLAWDAPSRSLWMTMGGGLCACVYRLDPTTGDVTLRFFPRCEPLGIAVSSAAAGRDVLIVGDNGPGRPARLLQRSITAAADRFGRPTPARYTRRFYKFPTGLRPRAVSADSGGIWILDSERAIRWFAVEGAP